MKKLTEKQFIERAKEIHGNKYDYSKTKFINLYKKIIIICKIHGEFKQIAKNHLRGGCAKCGNGMLSEKEFIKKAEKIHNNTYDYSKSKYKTHNDKIIITCKIHGDFKQKPIKHLAGQGCRKCKKYKLRKHFQLDREEVVRRSKEVHGDKYDYSLVEYDNLHKKVKIICPEHGIFEQCLNSHIRGPNGCPRCACSKFNSKASNSWLNGRGINNREVPLIMKCGKQYIVDGFDEENNIVYEFLGDFWHGNPEVYNKNDENKRMKEKFGTLYERTIYKIKKLVLNGYKVIYKWETLPHDIGVGEQYEK